MAYAVSAALALALSATPPAPTPSLASAATLHLGGLISKNIHQVGEKSGRGEEEGGGGRGAHLHN